MEAAGKIYLQKFCRQHGFSQALICSDPAWYRESLRYVKPKQNPLQVRDFRGCPQSCGSCPEHQQHTCLPVIEITSACDLDCPVCLKHFAKPFQMSTDAFEGIIDMLLRCEGRVDVINLSGGEPTLHPRLGDFLRLAKAKGIMQTTVSTNGLRLLSDPGLRRLMNHAPNAGQTAVGSPISSREPAASEGIPTSAGHAGRYSRCQTPCRCVCFTASMSGNY